MNIFRKRIVKLVQNYIDDLNWSMKGAKSREERRQIVYGLSAADDILERILESYADPADIVSEYIDIMDEYCTKNQKNSYMFSVGYDTAYDIYDRLLTYYDNLYSYADEEGRRYRTGIREKI